MTQLTKADMQDLVFNILENASRLVEAEKNLREIQSQADKKIVDLLHSIELEPSKSGVGGYLAYKELRDTLEMRRAAKDAYDYYQSCKAIVKTARRKATRIYSPRAT